MDVCPVTAGHVLVVPTRHASNLAELDESDASAMIIAAGRLSAAIRQSGIRAEGVNWFLADGEAAGQEVFHVHLRVFPRYSGDGFDLKFGPDYGRIEERAALDEHARAIAAAMGL